MLSSSRSRLCPVALALLVLAACSHASAPAKPRPSPMPKPSPTAVTRAAMAVMCRDLEQLRGVVNDAAAGRLSTSQILGSLRSLGPRLGSDATALQRSGQPEASRLVRDVSRAVTEIPDAIDRGQNEFVVITSNLGRIGTDLQRIVPGRCSTITSPSPR